MDPHVHITPVHILATTLAVIAVFGTLHLLAMSQESRAGRAFMALGF